MKQLLTSYYILEEDKMLARQRIAEIEREILELGPAFHEALNQTSETWHDNAPFDTLREKQSVLVAELQSLKEVLGKSAPATPKQSNQHISIGARVKIKHHKDNSHRHYLLAGHWSYRIGQFIDDALVISCQSPLGASLLGKKIGESVTLPNNQQLTVVGLS